MEAIVEAKKKENTQRALMKKSTNQQKPMNEAKTKSTLDITVAAGARAKHLSKLDSQRVAPLPIGEWVALAFQKSLERRFVLPEPSFPVIAVCLANDLTNSRQVVSA